MLQRREWIFINGKTIRHGSKDFSGYGSRQARELAPELSGPKGGKATVELFHREKRPALKRYIIDTSEWTRAGYRYVIGQHFRL